MRWPGFRKVRRQVCRRVSRRLNELGLADFEAYRQHLESAPEEWSVLDSYCRISISRFYRDWDVFDRLRDHVLPELAAQRLQDGEPLRCWSCGCASGEEPYTLAIVWRHALAERFADVPCRILATDIEPLMLERARRGCYPASSLKGLPGPWREAAFLERQDDGSVREAPYCLRPAYRDMVTLREMDVRRQVPDGPFSLILCRNLVFTYFERPLQAETLQRLVECLASGGWLVTAKKEELPPGNWPLRRDPRVAGIYQRSDTLAG